MFTYALSSEAIDSVNTTVHANHRNLLVAHIVSVSCKGCDFARVEHAGNLEYRSYLSL
jgi:hypothetical protein